MRWAKDNETLCVKYIYLTRTYATTQQQKRYSATLCLGLEKRGGLSMIKNWHRIKYIGCSASNAS